MIIVITMNNLSINGQPLKLTEKVCNNLLKVYIDKGYKHCGTLTIKNGAELHKNFRVLAGEEENTTEIHTPKNIYATFFRAIEHANSKGAYGLDDAAVIDNLMEFVNTSILKEEEN
jgi:hypothetical protein